MLAPNGVVDNCDQKESYYNQRETVSSADAFTLVTGINKFLVDVENAELLLAMLRCRLAISVSSRAGVVKYGPDELDVALLEDRLSDLIDSLLMMVIDYTEPTEENCELSVNSIDSGLQIMIDASAVSSSVEELTERAL